MTTPVADQPTTSMPPGHVFVVRGLLESIACDAVIVPTSSSFRPRYTWFSVLGVEDRTAPAGASDDRVRLFPTDSNHGPAWLLNVAHDGHRSVDWLVDGLRAAFDRIAADLALHSLGDGRVRPLVALPTLGVGQGGYEGVRGEVIRALHSTAMDFVAHSDFDVVFVVENAADYAAFQSIRKAASNEGRDEAKRLAELIAGGDVALLLGAGVSISAGLPTWDNLLGQLKNTLLPNLDPEVFSELGVLDQAQLLANSSPSKALGHSVSQLIKSVGVKKPTLSHCLLASLNVAKVVTTNYDSLYEDAFNAAHRSASISVLPRGDVVAHQPWLLKMHGDVEDPDSIVLSRRDFVQYDAERRPLGSIVQSLMSTGHLVVIGASMTDDNVLRLAHEVLAMNARYDQERVLGTVITLRPDAIRSALWKGDFDFIPASTASTDAVAARDLEILLDRVAMHASEQSRYLLDPRYAELLADDEQRLARTLREVAGAINGLSIEKKSRWTALSAVISELGHTPNSETQL